jgi:hypothetical protein
MVYALVLSVAVMLVFNWISHIREDSISKKRDHW